MKTFALLLLSLIAASDIAAAQSAAISKTEQEARLLALADVDFGDVYSADGAGDGTLTYQGEILKSQKVFWASLYMGKNIYFL